VCDKVFLRPDVSRGVLLTSRHYSSRKRPRHRRSWLGNDIERPNPLSGVSMVYVDLLVSLYLSVCI
jgi:hypothetical protein